METTYAVKVDNKIIYQSKEEDRARHVSYKTGGRFVRLLTLEGDLTTYDLKNKSEETINDFFDRLVAINIHLMEKVKELEFEKTGLVLEKTELCMLLNNRIANLEGEADESIPEIQDDRGH